MREILFRAWDDVKDKMYHAGEEADVVFELTGVGIKATAITEDEEEFRTLHHLKYMQYTGLKDKDGTNIYDGDIVHFVYEPGPDYGWKANQICEIKNEPSGLIFGRITKNKYAKMCGYLVSIPHGNGQFFEVIGNIYEHPHLLEGDELVHE